MAYTKTNWQNDQAPAINATNLNKIEQGIFNNDALLSSIMNTLGIDTQTWVSTDSYVEGQVVVYNNQLYKNITGNYTTTPPDEDTTNWEEIQIINNNGKLNKSLIPYFNNSRSNATDEGYSCDFINKLINGTTLWTNSNPTSSFLGQEIALNLSDYNYIEIVYRRYPSIDARTYVDKIYVGDISELKYHDYEQGVTRSWVRFVNVENNKITFADCYIDGQLINGGLVPYKIIGYK